MPNDNEVEQPVRLKKDGTLVQKQDGTDVTIATFDRDTGHLEFETKEYSTKFYNQVTQRIGSVNKGTTPSGLTIKSMGVKGQAPAVASGRKKPKAGPEGDGDPVVVDFMIRERLPQAIIQYGIFTDKDGKPIRKRIRRVIEVRRDLRQLEQRDIPAQKTGPNTEDKSAISIAHKVIEGRNVIIARRPTRCEDDPDVLESLGVEKLEYLASTEEVVGGWAHDDEEEDTAGVAVSEEAE